MTFANPYLDIVESIDGLDSFYPSSLSDGMLARSTWNGYLRRTTPNRTPRRELFADDVGLVHLFAWAIPNDEALETIARYGPVAEVAAGTGYWSALLADRGVDVVASDRLELDHHWKGVTWFPVEKRDAVEHAASVTDRSLLLVWPDMSNLASRILDAYRGDVLIYVGEPDGGCTADSEFFSRLRTEWVLEADVSIPRWWGLHDYLTVYRRIRVGKPQGLDPARLAGT